MEVVNIWQSLAQAGIAILILGVGAYIFWKQIQQQFKDTKVDMDALRADLKLTQKGKDDLQKEFNAYIVNSNTETKEFMSNVQDKYIKAFEDFSKSQQENTAMLQDLKNLIEKKF